MQFFNQDVIQSEFLPAMAFAGRELLAYFGERLQAVYLSGSVASGEAIPGVSDVDWFMFLDPEPGEEEVAWCEALKTSVMAQFPVVGGYNLTPYPVTNLQQDSFWRFATRYNSVRLYGRDLLADLDARGIPTDPPSRQLAVGRIGWLKPILDDLREGIIREYIYTPPALPCLAARKMARYFVICEGAYWLMADGRYPSFRSGDVLPALQAHHPEWATLYRMTAAVLRDPYAIDFTEETYRHEVIPFFAEYIEYLVCLSD